MRRLALTLLTSSVLISCQDVEQPTAPESSTPPAAFSAQAAGGQVQDYIVVFRPDVADPAGLARVLVDQHGGSLRFTYEAALKGFSASLPAQAVEALENNPNVAYVELDQVVTTTTDQTNATWGLDRIDQRTLPLNGVYSYQSDGSGVTAYIIDTGIRITHTDFGGRASYGYDFVGNDPNADDCHGHGTHVGGTVGGSTWGVAKGVSLVAVRVLNCAGSGTWQGVIAGIDWVAANHVSPAVANMSLGGGYSQAVNDAVTNSISSGVTFAVSAGNSNANACNYSPASTPNALTVASTTSSDNRSSFSNIGTCVDLFAPGSSITSAWKNSDTSTNTISGTSMSSPHVAGVAALYLQQNPSATPSQVETGIESAATSGAVGNAGSGSPNLLLYSSPGTSSPTPPLIQLSTTTADFTATAGGGSPAAQQVAVTNGGTESLTGLATSVSYQGGQPTGWLSANLSSTEAPSTLTLTATTGSLAAGTYNATVDVTSGVATNSPQTVTVTFTVETQPVTSPGTQVEVASHAVTTVGNGKKGVATIRIEELNTSTGVAGVTVDGVWSGGFDGPGSGVTDSNGNVTIQTPNSPGATSFTFCIDGVSGSGIVEQTGLNDCATSGGGGGDPPPGGSPSNLSVHWKDNGRARADLSWTGGGSQVDVIENGSVTTTIANSGSYRDLSPGTSYQVCEVGQTSPDKCTDVVNKP